MPNKILAFDEEARNKLIKGIEILSRAVTSTLGPKGNNVALDRNWGAPAVVHDGASVARDIDLDDNFENMGAKLVKQAAIQTGEGAGDGTTTSVLLAYEIANLGNQLIKQGFNAMSLRKGIEKAATFVLEEINKKSTPIKSKEDLTRIATISAGDEEIGQKIADALDKVGENGIVTVEDGQTTTIDTEYKEGMQFDQGYISMAFINRREYLDTMMDDVDILVVHRKLSTINDINGLDAYFKLGRKLLMIVSEIEGQALEALVMTRAQSGIPLCIVRAPGFGDYQQQILEDITYLTGGLLISEENGKSIEKLSPDLIEFGHAEKVNVTRDFCRIIGGKASKELLQTRIDQIKEQIKNSTSDYDISKLTERLAKLTGGVAVIKVGASSESEMIEKRERAKDAVEACNAAMADGIVAGGGITLYNIGRGEEFQKLITEEKNKDTRHGMDLIRNSLYAPIKKLLSNYGYNEDQINNYINGLLLRYKDGFGINFETGEEQVNMLEAGIIDPTKVTKLAFKNAVSVAISILTTCCLVSDIKENKIKTE